MKSVVYAGKKYKSLSEMAQELGISSVSLYNQLNNSGKVLEDAVSYLTKYLCGLDGESYATLSDMCRSYGMSLHHFELLLNLGFTKEQVLASRGLRYRGVVYNDIPALYKKGYEFQDLYNAIIERKDLFELKALPVKKACKVDYLGVEYKNEKSLAYNYKVNISTFRGRLDRGWDLEKALTEKVVKNCVGTVEDHLGNVFNNMTDMAEYYGLSRFAVVRRLARGDSLEDALTVGVRERRVDMVEDHLGNKYKDVRTMANSYGLKYNTYVMRRRRGWSLERILTTPTRKRGS